MKLTIGGGVGEHGRNCFYIQDNICYAVDCGVMRGSENPYPRLSDERIRNIKYLFLTHSHEDHIGAFFYFRKKGFNGVVIGAEETLAALPRYGEKFALPRETHIISFPDVVFSFGRSGHCVGGVWYRVSTTGGSTLFSGDYSEESAFNVDKIENLSADMAVLDCAFGGQDYNAEKQLKKITDYVTYKKGVILPVPKNGRAIDLIYRLSSMGKQVYVDSAQSSFLKRYLKDKFWIKPEIAKAVCKLHMLPLTEFKGDGIAFVSDAQLVKEENRALIRRYSSGVSVLFTGHCDDGSFSAELLNAKKADKIPFNAHCNKRKADEIAARNRFGKVVLYHCGDPIKSV